MYTMYINALCNNTPSYTCVRRVHYPRCLCNHDNFRKETSHNINGWRTAKEERNKTLLQTEDVKHIVIPYNPSKANGSKTTFVVFEDSLYKASHAPRKKCEIFALKR